MVRELGKYQAFKKTTIKVVFVGSY